MPKVIQSLLKFFVFNSKVALRLFWRKKKVWGFTTYLFLSLICTTSYIASVASSLTANTTISATLAVESVDLQNAVGKAAITNPWSDNGWRAYGPVLYRVANLAASFGPNIGYPDIAASAHQKREARHHFFLTMISSMSTFILGWILACLISSSLPTQLIIASIMGSVFLKTPYWANETFLVHPDIIVAPIAAGLAYWTIRGTFQKPQSSSLFPISGLIGLGLATKMTFLFFLPTVFTSLFHKNLRKYLNRLAVTFLVAFFVYMLVGFPQSLGILGVLEFLINQSQYTAPVNYESMLRWTSIFLQELSITIPFVVILSVLACDEAAPKAYPIAFNTNKTFILKFLVQATLPFITLITCLNFIPEFAPATGHYSISFTAYTMVPITLLIVFGSRAFLSKIPKKILKLKNLIGPLLLLSFVYANGVGAPSAFNSIAKENAERRSEMSELMILSTNLADLGATGFITPYFPNTGLEATYSFNQRSVENFLTSKTPISPDIFLMIDWNWYSRFLTEGPSDYDLAGIGADEWHFSNTFFKSLFAQKTIKGLGDFKLVYKHKTSEIWATESLISKISSR
ncbi:hypothetical protein OAS89_03795 [Alphaproteobacteria bacterium]|nr:hypothetical protein [Alphaproteobacteria bacterium]